MFRTMICATTALAAALAWAPAGEASMRQTAPAPQTAAPQAAAATVAVTDVDPALWVVKDADTTIYLFGTVHILKPGLGWFDEAVKTAFDKSDKLVLEMVEPDQATIQGIVMRMAVNPQGPTLTEQLPEDKRGPYAAAMTAAGIPPAAFERVDPWLAAVTLSVATLPKLGYDINSGVEKQLTAAAKTANKPVEGLETAEQQFGFFDALPQPVQIRFLVSTVDMMDQLAPTLDKMVAQWGAGKPDDLAATMNEGMRDTPEVAKVLLNDRNARWAEWIEKRLAEPGTSFVAVGAGHLAGPDSVQAHLGKRKLKAERIQY